MKNRIKRMSILLLAFAMMVSGIQLTEGSVLDGAKADSNIPVKNEEGLYELSKPEHLVWFSNLLQGKALGADGTLLPQEREAGCKLIEDIDCTTLESWQGIPAMKGLFDGNGKALKNLNMTKKSFIDYNSGIIKNLIIESGEFSFDKFGGGSLARVNRNDGVISGCINKAKLNSEASVGGLVSNNAGVLVYSLNSGDISSTATSVRNFAGGIASTNSGNILNSYNVGKIDAKALTAGGLSGLLIGKAMVKNCYNAGDVQGKITGLMAGEARVGADVELLNNYCLKSGDKPAIGLDKNNTMPENSVSIVEKIEASKLGSAFVDDSEPYVNSGFPPLSYQKTGSYPEIENMEEIEVTELKENTDTTLTFKLNKKIEYIKLNRLDFKVYLPKWRYSSEYIQVRIKEFIQKDDELKIKIPDIELLKTDKPRTVKIKLKFKEKYEKEFDIKMGASSGWSAYYEKPEKIKPGDPKYSEFAGYYKISTPEELSWLSNYVSGQLENGAEPVEDVNAFLANDIYLNDTKDWKNWDNETQNLRFWDESIGFSAYGYESLGEDTRFSGIFDGNGHSIKGMYCVSSADIGENRRNNFNIQHSLFGYVKNGTIKNLGVEESYIYSVRPDILGGIVCVIRDGKIENCYFAGKMEGKPEKGLTFSGIAGGGTGKILSCYNLGSIGEKGDSANAGIMYSDYGSGDKDVPNIVNCYNAGTVGNKDARASYGISDKGAKYCYNKGKVEGKSVHPVCTENPNINYYLSDEENPSEQYAIPLTTEQFKDGTLLEKLGEPYVADTENINEGMPILNWQSKLYNKKKNIDNEIEKAIEIEKYNLSKKDIRDYIETKKDAIEEAESLEKVDEIISQIKEYVKQNFHTDEEIENQHANLNEQIEEAGNQIKNIEAEIAKLKAKFAFLAVKGGLLKTNFVYTGKAVKPQLKLVDAEGRKLVEGKDFTLSYANNYLSGTAKVKVTANGDYLGERSYSFKIVPRKAKISSIKAKRRALYLKWGKLSEGSGYELMYASNSKFRAGKMMYVKSSRTVSKTVSQLVKGRRYYVKVRAYKATNAGRLYGAWSAARSIKVR